MLKRLRSTWLAGGGAVLLVLSMTGLAFAASHVAETSDPAIVSPTLLTFEDLNGDGIDDDCAANAVTADPAAAAAAFLLVDADADGTISTTEAAHSDWVGGKNCNHGGYVSGVAQGTDDACDEADQSKADESETDETTTAPVTTTPTTTVGTCDQGTEEAKALKPVVVCPVVEPVAPTADAPTLDLAPSAHGVATSLVAHSLAVGGKNCNHGGAVSEAAKKDNAAKADVKAKHAHATKATKSHGKGHAAK